jgi:hypothetical protein
VLGKIEGATVDVARDRGKFLAFVVSPAYEGVDEGDRQAFADQNGITSSMKRWRQRC